MVRSRSQTRWNCQDEVRVGYIFRRHPEVQGDPENREIQWAAGQATAEGAQYFTSLKSSQRAPIPLHFAICDPPAPEL